MIGAGGAATPAIFKSPVLPFLIHFCPALFHCQAENAPPLATKNANSGFDAYY
jgi:hypothetical protein